MLMVTGCCTVCHKNGLLDSNISYWSVTLWINEVWHMSTQGFNSLMQVLNHPSEMWNCLGVWQLFSVVSNTYCLIDLHAQQITSCNMQSTVLVNERVASGKGRWSWNENECGFFLKNRKRKKEKCWPQRIYHLMIKKGRLICLDMWNVIGSNTVMMEVEELDRGNVVWWKICDVPR